MGNIAGCLHFDGNDLLKRNKMTKQEREESCGAVVLRRFSTSGRGSCDGKHRDALQAQLDSGVLTTPSELGLALSLKSASLCVGFTQESHHNNSSSSLMPNPSFQHS